MNNKYILNDQGVPVVEPDVMKWGQWFETADRQVALDIIGDVRVSTVFLGLDHSFGRGEPILWETMVFGGKCDQHQDRCAGTKTDAQEMHNRMLAEVKAAQ